MQNSQFTLFLMRRTSPTIHVGAEAGSIKMREKNMVNVWELFGWEHAPLSIPGGAVLE